MEQVESGIKEGYFVSGDILPSMNELSARLDISKETVKKAYFLLRDKGVISSTQGKGYYIAEARQDKKMKILLLLTNSATSSRFCTIPSPRPSVTRPM